MCCLAGMWSSRCRASATACPHLQVEWVCCSCCLKRFCRSSIVHQFIQAAPDQQQDTGAAALTGRQCTQDPERLPAVVLAQVQVGQLQRQEQRLQLQERPSKDSTAEAHAALNNDTRLHVAWRRVQNRHRSTKVDHSACGSRSAADCRKLHCSLTVMSPGCTACPTWSSCCCCSVGGAGGLNCCQR